MTVADGLHAHVPALALAWIEDQPDRRWRVTDGSLCFADISGFTALSERLEARGRKGAEELVEVLNNVFGPMVGAAGERGGQLLKFGGDALLLYFEGDEHAVRACAAAVEMRRALRRAVDLPTAVGRLRLSMSVGVGSGPVHLFLVGSPHRQLVVAGPVVAATLTAERAAAAGEIFVAPGTAARLPRHATRETRAVDEDHRLLRWRVAPPMTTAHGPPRTFAPTTAWSLLPPLVSEALVTHPDPGHRVATMAFVRLSGLDPLIARDIGTACDALDDTIRHVQGALAAEGVAMLEIDVDIDGAKIVCSSGAPARTEDDEDRMLRALRAITAAPLPLAVQAGVNRGHVFTAAVGGRSRSTYSAMGDTTNTAARIAATAPHGLVYAHPSVLDHARMRYAARPVGPFTFKGKAEPLLVYVVGDEVAPRDDAGHHRLRFVGRDAELTKLRGSVAAAASGTGSVLTIAGSTGQGKTRLAREALRQQDLVPLVALRAEPNGTSIPYRPFRDLLRTMLGVEVAPSATMATALVQGIERLDRSLVPLAPLLAAVAHIDVPPTQESEAVTESNRPDRTAALVIRILERVHPGPLVLGFDDAQWTDAASSHLLGRIATATAVHPWLLVVVRRDGDAGFDPGLGDRIELAGLDDVGARALLIAATEAAPLRPHEVTAIVARAAGNPRFVEELARTARVVGSLDHVPDSIEAVLSAQLDALPGPTRRAVALASILGRSFRRAVFLEVLGNEDLTLDTATEEGLQPFLEPDGDLRWRFVNGLVREVAYTGLPYRTRARLHRAAAETLERISTDGTVGADILAHHFEQAGDHQRTWTYSILAADWAREAYANAEAADHLARALDAARRLDAVSDAERLQRWLQLGDVRDRAGALDGALDAYRRAARLVGDDPAGHADLLMRRARTRERAGSFTAAMRDCTRAQNVLAAVPGRAAAERRAEALAFAALLRQRQERPHEALRVAQVADREAARAGARSAQARASNILSWAALMLGRPEATAMARRALELYEAVGDLDGQADMTNNLGVQAYFEGDWDSTVGLYRASRDLCERVGNIVDAAMTDANIGEVLVNRRQLEEAEPLLREASRVMRASGSRAGAAFADMHLGRVLTARGDHDGSERLLRGVIDDLVNMRRTASAYEATLHLGDCLTRAGRPEEALVLLGRAPELTSDDVSIFDAARARFTAEALAAAGRMAEAVVELEAGIAVARARQLTYELSLMLVDAGSWQAAVETGTDEHPLAEGRRLLDGLGVVWDPDLGESGPDHRHKGSPLPS